MNKEFIPYEQALELKDLGFDEECMFSYKQTLLQVEVPAPLYQQAFRWFRDVYGLYSFIFCCDEGFGYETYKEGVFQINEPFNTYEEAELACLNRLIEIVKNK